MTRRHPRPLIALALAGSLLGAPPVPARAQDTPGNPPILSCTAAIEGAVACMSGKLCLCRFDPGGELTGRPPRHRWDCGINRPSCGTAPADLQAGAGMSGSLPIAPIQPQVLIPYGVGRDPVPHGPWR